MPLKPLSLAEHRELIAVTTPQQLQPKIDFETFTLGPLLKRCQTHRPRSISCHVRVCYQKGGEESRGGLWRITLNIWCQGQLGQWRGMEQKGQPGDSL